MATRRAWNGLVAKESDVIAGEAIFYIKDGRSVPYEFGRELPIRARFVGEDSGFPTGTEIQIMQAERVDTGDVIIGYLCEETNQALRERRSRGAAVDVEEVRTAMGELGGSECR